MTNQIKNKDRSKKDARDIRVEAQKIANSQQVEGQNREHTRLIAAGIQRGMEQFLRQQNEKARDLDKRVKKVKRLATTNALEAPSEAEAAYGEPKHERPWLPWCLLIASWVSFGIYTWWSSN